ncbi:MAG: D-alanine--D-alanine ligase, partial [Ruminococcaceae bacterium]|nr:D-alanine--D-alanine ligase [Oscillospiraceae bacterium]
MDKKTIAILFGGRSSEHEVSRTSATMVINNIDREKYDIVIIGITKDGRWMLYEGDTALIKDGSWENSGATVPAVISPDTSVHGILVMRESGVETIRIDAAYPVMHGKNGEDGTMQGLMEMAGIPCVGCGCASSAVCMDKALTNTILEFCGIPQARFIWFYAADWREDKEKYIDAIEESVGFPCFVKPANAGSSVGISKCKQRSDVVAAVELAIENDSKVVVEEGIVGKEVETAV